MGLDQAGTARAAGGSVRAIGSFPQLAVGDIGLHRATRVAQTVLQVAGALLHQGALYATGQVERCGIPDVEIMAVGRRDRRTRIPGWKLGFGCGAARRGAGARQSSRVARRSCLHRASLSLRPVPVHGLGTWCRHCRTASFGGHPVRMSVPTYGRPSHEVAHRPLTHVDPDRPAPQRPSVPSRPTRIGVAHPLWTRGAPARTSTHGAPTRTPTPANRATCSRVAAERPCGRVRPNMPVICALERTSNALYRSSARQARPRPSCAAEAAKRWRVSQGGTGR